MKKLKFDANSMIQPKNDRDIVALLDEALAELKSINLHFAAMQQAQKIISYASGRS